MVPCPAGSGTDAADGGAGMGLPWFLYRSAICDPYLHAGSVRIALAVSMVLYLVFLLFGWRSVYILSVLRRNKGSGEGRERTTPIRPTAIRFLIATIGVNTTHEFNAANNRLSPILNAHHRGHTPRPVSMRFVYRRGGGLQPLSCLVFTALAPRIWAHLERFDTGADYRIPYSLSSDYWLYQRRANSIDLEKTIPVIGDSVVWGEYVLKDGTLSHYLSQESGQQGRFANCGVNGVFPLALEGLVGQYGSSFQNCKVIVHCNLLWESSPKADLSIDSEETFQSRGARAAAVWRGTLLPGQCR